MAWTYAYTPRIWPPVFTVLLLIGLAIYTWRRRSVPGALPFTFALLFGALWAGGSMFEELAVDLATKIAWVKFQAAWQLPGGIAVTCFLLEFTWPGRWLTRRKLILLAIVPLLLDLFILTNNLHHLFWRSFTFTGKVASLLGPLGWFGVACGYSLVIVNFIVLAWLYQQSPQHRWFVVIMLATQLIFRAFFLLDITHVIRSNLPLDVFGIAFAYLMYSIALFRFHVLNPVPLARQTVIDQMREGMFVADREGRVVSLNPAAVELLGMPEGQACGRLLQEVLPSIPPFKEGDLSEAEITLGTGTASRIYLLSISSLKDWRGQEAGHLLLLLDMTEQRKSQAQILEQQQALSILHERERLARELHDELAQDLALINIQAQLVCGTLEAGQEEQARRQLQILARAAREAHVDVRGEISRLSHRADPAEGFWGSLRHFIESFRETYGVEVDLALPEDVRAITLAPTAEVQLLRIVQEAFANIRKHARAKHARVFFSKEPGCIQLCIEDDGIGFNAGKLPTSHESFGLGIMSQRAAEVGGRLEVKSELGRGTQVMIQVPVIEEAS